MFQKAGSNDRGGDDPLEVGIGVGILTRIRNGFAVGPEGGTITPAARTLGIVETGDTGARVDGMTALFEVTDIEETAAVRIDGRKRTIGLVETSIGPMFEAGRIRLNADELRKIEVIVGKTVIGPDCRMFDAL